MQALEDGTQVELIDDRGRTIRGVVRAFEQDGEPRYEITGTVRELMSASQVDVDEYQTRYAVVGIDLAHVVSLSEID